MFLVKDSNFKKMIQIRHFNLENKEININEISDNFSYEDFNFIILIYDTTNKNSFGLIKKFYEQKKEFKNYYYFGGLDSLQRKGFGILINYNKLSIYSGNWDKDLKNGNGKLYKENNLFEGEWENDTFKNGKLYMGNIIYEGAFLGEKIFSGYTIFENIKYFSFFEDKYNFSLLKNENIIEGRDLGNFNINKGDGIIKYKNGNIFIGSLDNFKREGKGIMIINKKNYFISEWENDELLKNTGILILENGDIYKGNLMLIIMKKNSI